jgi:ATP/ADP translocase
VFHFWSWQSHTEQTDKPSKMFSRFLCSGKLLIIVSGVSLFGLAKHTEPKAAKAQTLQAVLTGKAHRANRQTLKDV